MLKLCLKAGIGSGEGGKRDVVRPQRDTPKRNQRGPHLDEFHMFRFMLLGMRFYFFSASAPAAAPRASVTSRRGFLRTASAVIAATVLVGGLSACVVDNSDSNNSSSKNSSGDKALTVFATTGYIGDAVRSTHLPAHNPGFGQDSRFECGVVDWTRHGNSHGG